MQKGSTKLVYKILSAGVWNTATEVVPSMPIDLSDGFVHLSTATQLAETLALHFRDQATLRLLAIRTADIEANLRWELSRGGERFPHVYGQIPISAVDWSTTVDVAADGTCDLPPEIK